uniref:ISXO2-like transposase domain-containing protein n=1 Tax=Candidatus Kentrum sp. SD TaxID=2126332 RepID=A0A450YIX4_9GAMM|nr:MAG: ISXO2-like transposase domain-containing protein [Candidatus Kentron sp. SD]VFK41451.1 MAG: ISXO2-like transposase domain-containing protein [Candidatus Kentron sp. SD]
MKPTLAEKRRINTVRSKLHAERGAAGKQAVVGIRERDTGTVKASTVSDTTRETLHSMARDNAESGTTVYSDEHKGYIGLNFIGYFHDSVNHSAKEFVNLFISRSALQMDLVLTVLY